MRKVNFFAMEFFDNCLGVGTHDTTFAANILVFGLET